MTRDSTGVHDPVEPTAALPVGSAAGVAKGPHGGANDLVTSLHDQRGRDRGVHSPRHGHEDSLPPYPHCRLPCQRPTFRLCVGCI